MDKYSFTIDNWGVTYEKHNQYKRLISETLSELYPDRVFIDGFYYVLAQEFDNEGSYVSIINKAIGNITLIKSFIINYNIKSFDELIEFVKNNKIDLFKQGGIYFDDILQVLKRSETKGIKNEIKALSHIESYLKSKNIDFELRQTPAYSKEDVIEGIDIIITINQKDWYVQVKPLKYFIRKNDIYEVISSGKIKKYENIHYYIFVNEGKCLLFSNKHLEVKNGIIYVPQINLKD